MLEWEERTAATVAKLIGDGFFINEMPDDDGLAQCRDFGKNAANA